MPLTKTREDVLVATALMGLGASLVLLYNRYSKYKPPRVWTYDPDSLNTWLNRPTAGAQTDRELPRGTHPLQLYSLATPNGVKVTALLEELNMRYGIEYDAFTIDITKGDQFTTGFVAANPNSKIPVLLHYENDKTEPTSVFETAAIMIYLCEKFDKDHILYPPPDSLERAACLSWLMWTQGSAPYLGGGFGHFFHYAPIKVEYGINRYSMETKRLYDVLDQHLGVHGPYLCGDNLTIADLAAWPWYGALILREYYKGAVEFLSLNEYTNVVIWAELVATHKTVKRGSIVNKTWGKKEEQLHERHSSLDFQAAAQIVQASEEAEEES